MCSLALQKKLFRAEPALCMIPDCHAQGVENGRHEVRYKGTGVLRLSLHTQDELHKKKLSGPDCKK